MKFKLVFIALIWSFQSFSHDYYFAFTEAKYNDISGKIEATIIASTHDLERVLEIEELDIADLSKIKNDDKESRTLEAFINKHLVFDNGKEVAHLSLIGLEVLLNGEIQIYVESSPIDLIDRIEIKFDLMMDLYKSQQNKITFYYQDKSFTHSFLFNSRKQTIELTNT